MSYADELLALAKVSSSNPSDAENRRRVSTAYYAVFHLIVEEALVLINPLREPVADNLGRRVPTHTGLKSLAAGFVAQAGQKTVPRPKQWAEANYDGDPSPELVELATKFVSLHSFRERADYDLGTPVPLLDVQNQVDHAGDVFDLVRVKGVPTRDWRLFLVSVMLLGRKG